MPHRSRTLVLLAAVAAMAASFFARAAPDDALKRVATLPLGAEVTGLFAQAGDLFLNVQHPAPTLPEPESRAAVGVIADAEFSGADVPFPAAAPDKQTVRSSLGEYQVLLRAGDFDGKAGLISGAGGKIQVSNRPDFNAYVATGDHEGYLFTAWEDRPGGMSRVRLTRSGDGKWSTVGSDFMMIDFSAVGGTWLNCFGTLSPWGTPLSSEELDLTDTDRWNSPRYAREHGVETLASYKGAYPNPYDYGYIVEISDPAGSSVPVKHFAMGRFGHENSVVMPDRRTVYLSDDGTGAVFFKFVADAPGDLSAGTLFAAKVTQLAGPGAPAGRTDLGIRWIRLAHGRDGEIRRWVREYDGITIADYAPGGNSYIGDAEVAAWAAGDAVDDRAAFLETRKAAVAKGASGEFEKMEGVNINLEGAADGRLPYMYMAMSYVRKRMTDDKGDIRLAPNPCGVVYRMKLDADFDVDRMVPVVAGGPYDENEAPDACTIDNVANPDNIIVLDDGGVVIGEDTHFHQNAAVWLWREP